MDQIEKTISTCMKKYQEEIHKNYPSVSVSKLQSIWDKLNEKPVEKEKKKRTAYQNYFVFCREQITNENPCLKFGDISKLISAKWNDMDAEEKSRFASATYSPETVKNVMNIEKHDSYVHLFETIDDGHDQNRIDYEHDDNIDSLDQDDDEEELDQDEIDFDEIE